jgi:hypothetical protein
VAGIILKPENFTGNAAFKNETASSVLARCKFKLSVIVRKNNCRQKPLFLDPLLFHCLLEEMASVLINYIVFHVVFILLSDFAMSLL